MASGINSFSVGFEPSAADKVGGNYGTTILRSFSVSFELSTADKRYYETTTIKSFSVSFEQTPLYVEMINTHRG